MGVNSMLTLKILSAIGMVLVPLVFSLIPSLHSSMRPMDGTIPAHIGYESNLKCLIHCLLGGIMLGTYLLHCISTQMFDYSVMIEVQGMTNNTRLELDAVAEEDLALPLPALASVLCMFALAMIRQITKIRFVPLKNCVASVMNPQRGYQEVAGFSNVGPKPNEEDGDEQVVIFEYGSSEPPEQDTDQQHLPDVEGEVPQPLSSRAPDVADWENEPIWEYLLSICHLFFQGMTVALQHRIGSLLLVFFAVTFYLSFKCFWHAYEKENTGLGWKSALKKIFITQATTLVGFIIGCIILSLFMPGDSVEITLSLLVFHSFTSGSFLYAAIFETFLLDSSGQENEVMKTFSTFIGFMFIFALSFIY